MATHSLPLRQRMIDDMSIRKMLSRAQDVYIRVVANFRAYIRRSPDQVTAEDIAPYADRAHQKLTKCAG